MAKLPSTTLNPSIPSQNRRTGVIRRYDVSMFTSAASSRMFHIDRELDYNSVISSDHRESWGSDQLYPAIVRVHTEMPAQDVPLHWHLGSELVYARHGGVRLFIDGLDVILRSGQLCLISPKALHSIHPIPHDDSQNVLSISFDGEYLSRMCPELASIPLNQGVIYGVDGIVDGRLLGLCEQIVGCVEDDDSALQMLQLNALLYELLYHVCTQCSEVNRHAVDDSAKHVGSNVVSNMAGDTANTSDDVSVVNGGAMESDATTGSDSAGVGVRHITEYMEQHYAQDLSIGQIASQFGYSREHFSRLFKRGTGVTPDRYLTEIRLQSAFDDLLNTGDTVAQIAEHNGFPNVRSFTTAFTGRFSATPAAYRRAHKA